MNTVKKAYGYVTRMKEGKIQVLVFRHSNPKAGIQIPKGTVKTNEDTYHAVIREMKEETGLKHFEVRHLLAEDDWENDDGVTHHRYFYQIHAADAPEQWKHHPRGGGDEAGLTFHYFWISSKDEVELIRGHGDYLEQIFS